jgi:hypothetical protein
MQAKYPRKLGRPPPPAGPPGSLLSGIANDFDRAGWGGPLPAGPPQLLLSGIPNEFVASPFRPMTVDDGQ